MIRDVRIEDAARIAEIYNYYIEETIVTFEYDTVSVKEIENRINKMQSKRYPYFVYEEDGLVLGYAYLSNWRERVAYDITLETSVYLDRNFMARGLGSIMYEELITRARKKDIHSLIGSISLPNDASRKLHKKLNFELIGKFKESGVKFGKLIDVEFWQLIL